MPRTLNRRRLFVVALPLLIIAGLWCSEQGYKYFLDSHLKIECDLSGECDLTTSNSYIEPSNGVVLDYSYSSAFITEPLINNPIRFVETDKIDWIDSRSKANFAKNPLEKCVLTFFPKLTIAHERNEAKEFRSVFSYNCPVASESKSWFVFTNSTTNERMISVFNEYRKRKDEFNGTTKVAKIIFFFIPTLLLSIILILAKLYTLTINYVMPSRP